MALVAAPLIRPPYHFIGGSEKRDFPPLKHAPNEQAVKIVGGTVVLLLAVWFGLENRRFKGPPEACSVLREA